MVCYFSLCCFAVSKELANRLIDHAIDVEEGRERVGIGDWFGLGVLGH